MDRKELKMSIKDMDRMRELLEKKKTKSNFFGGESVIGSGKVEKKNKNIGTDNERTKKISQ